MGRASRKDIDDVRRECHALMAKPEPDETTKPTRGVPLFREFVSGPWKDAHFPRYKPSTRKCANFALGNQLLPAFGATPLDRVTRHQVLRWFNTYSRSAPGGANLALGVLRQILNFAMACGHIDVNPANAVKPNRRAALTRFLSHDELRRLHHTLDECARRGTSAKQQADIIRLLLLTGCRKREILTLRWSEVQGDTLALADSKTGPRTVPLNAQARRVIDRQPRGQSEFVFPSPRNINRPRAREVPLWYSVRREAGIEDVRLHDLRHNLASYAVMNGIPVPVVSRLLGHSNVRMTLCYAHLVDKDIEAAAERVGTAMARVMALECPHPTRPSRASIDGATVER